MDVFFRRGLWGLLVVLVSISGNVESVRGQPQSTQPGVRVATGVYGVVYRPPSTTYRFLGGEHFDVIYQVGAEDMAYRTRRALRRSWPGTDSLVGQTVDDFHTPVVINNYNDESNGFVAPFPFRQEIETPSIKSSELVARSSSWPALVGPHELVHSAQAEIQPGIGIGRLGRVFAPDWTRGMNLVAPPGLTEGIAVYRESHLEPGAGRLNTPLFQMKMEAAMLSDDPWNITQMMEASAYTQPYDRHYVGGAHAFEYLATRGDSTSLEFYRTATAWHNRIPFLGHGVWLGLATGQFPHQLTSELQAELQETYQTRLDRRRPFTPVSIVDGERGLNHRRPYWLDDTTLVAYVYGYDTRPGFYRVDAETGARSPIRVQTLTEDRVYSLGRDTTALYASRYVQDPLVPSREIAEIEQISLGSGTVKRLTEEGRALAPAEASDGRLYAVTNDGAFTRWAELKEGRLSPLTPDAPTTIRQVAPSPTGEEIAVLINAEGDQRIYHAQMAENGAPRIEPWIGLEGAIVYDVSWGPKGRYLLFAADHPDTANIFAFDTHTERVLQLANVPFGAREPALSPDRTSVAFVNYQHERHDLVRIPFRPDSAATVPDSVVQISGPSPRASVLEASAEVEGDTTSRPYSAWRHLSPRMVYPVIRGGGEELNAVANPRAPLGLGVGIGVAGSDPLQKWAYRGRTYWQDGRLWGEARIQSGHFLLRPSLSIFNRGYNVNTGSIVGFEERGVSVGAYLPVIPSSNVYQSYLRFALDTELRQTRLFGRDPSLPTPYTTRLTFSPTAQVGYRLQQNPRDVVPNTGLAFGLRGEFDAWHDGGRNRVRARRALQTELHGYFPGLRASHTGLRLGLGVLTQNQAALLGSSTFLPRGFEDATLSAGTFLRLDGVVTQPLWYVDNGLFLVPLYVKSVSVYGFGQTLGRLSNTWREAATSVGAGLSVETRLFYTFDFDLRIGAAYRLGPGDVNVVFR